MMGVLYKLGLIQIMIFNSVYSNIEYCLNRCWEGVDSTAPFIIVNKQSE